MNKDLDDALVSELGFSRKPPERAGLQQAIGAFLGTHLEQKTQIQVSSIEVIYDGSDVLLISATASGKTEAALIPVCARLANDYDRPVALYLAPTRALLNDLHRRVEAPLHQLGVEAAVRHGDRRLPRSVDRLRVVFTTPESLDVLLSRHNPLLERARFVIIDEIHQLYGEPRGDHLGFLLRRLECHAGSRIQRIALSATVGNPDEVARWLCPQREPARVITSSQARHVSADFRWTPSTSELRDLLEHSGVDKTLCFANSRRRCEDIYLQLRDLYPLQTFVHYSTLTADQRHYVEAGFKAAQQAVCVTTSTLELGIDIGSIHDILLADPPSTVAGFLQRVGRGGRRGPTNHVTIAPRHTLELLQYVALLGLAEGNVVEERAAGQPYSIFVQQIFSHLAGKRRLVVHPGEIVEQLGTPPWLGLGQVTAILSALAEKGYLRREPGSPLYGVGDELEILMEKGRIYTNISDQETGIAVFHSGRLLATLPLASQRVTPGSVILFAGRFWRVTVQSDRGIWVELANAVPNPVRPVWGGRMALSANSLVARAMRTILLAPPALSGHRLDMACTARLNSLCDRVADLRTVSDTVWHQRRANKHIYYTFAGASENELISVLFHEAGARCSPSRRAEGIALEGPEPLDFSLLPDDIEEIRGAVDAHWRRLASSISVGPYFELLPAALKRAETAARFGQAVDLDGVLALAGCGVTTVDLDLVS